MPNVSVNGDPLLERLAHGYDGSGYRPVAVDTTGRVKTTMMISSASGAAGQLANAEADLYVCPASTIAFIRQCWLHNTTAGALAAYLYIKRSGGTSYRVLNVSLAANQGLCVEFGPLSAGDALRGYAAAAASINYEILVETQP